MMTMRKNTPQLLIAILLACPYFCLGEMAGGMNALHDSCCYSCSGHPSPSSGETPDSPDESQPDCLCHGAITGGARTTQVDFMAPLTISGWLLDAASSASAGPSWATLSFKLPHQFLPFSTGRDVCALTGALLL